MTQYVEDFDSPEAYPFRAVVYIRATFPNGETYTGSGAVVGQNDVLTSSHVIYSGADGGLADSITVYPGRDGFDSPFGSFSGSVVNYFEVDLNNDGLLSIYDTERDLAIIGFDTAFGDDTGWFGLDSYGDSNYYNLTGYPSVYADSTGPRMTNDYGFVESMYEDGYSAYEYVSIESNPGNSGGPLWYDDGDGPYLVGLASSSYRATDIYLHYTDISGWIEANDYLLGTDVSPVRANLINLYVATFGRAPDPNGLDYWQMQYDSLGLSGVAYHMMSSTEAQSRYPGGVDNTELVSAIYNNLFDRDPETAGLDYWVFQIESGAMSREDAIAHIVEAARGAAEGSPDSRILKARAAAAQKYLEQVESGDVTFNMDVAETVVMSVTSDSIVARDTANAVAEYATSVLQEGNALGIQQDQDEPGVVDAQDSQADDVYVSYDSYADLSLALTGEIDLY